MINSQSQKLNEECPGCKYGVHSCEMVEQIEKACRGCQWELTAHEIQKDLDTKDAAHEQERSTLCSQNMRLLGEVAELAKFNADCINEASDKAKKGLEQIDGLQQEVAEKDKKYRKLLDNYGILQSTKQLVFPNVDAQNKVLEKEITVLKAKVKELTESNKFLGDLNKNAFHKTKKGVDFIVSLDAEVKSLKSHIKVLREALAWIQCGAEMTNEHNLDNLKEIKRTAKQALDSTKESHE